MRKDTLTRRFQALNRPARVTITIPIQTLLRLEGIAKQQGMSRREAVQEAVRDWSVARERSLNRRRRLELTKAMREAADQKPIAELLQRFRAQMESVGEGKSETGLTSAEPSSINMPMSGTQTLRQRREALGLSREKLAREADISSASIEVFEHGVERQGASVARQKLEAALDDLEKAAA